MNQLPKAWKTMIGQARRWLWLAAVAGIAWGAEPAQAALRPDDVSVQLTAGDAGAVVVEWNSDIPPTAMVGWHVERQLPNGAVTRLTTSWVKVRLFALPGDAYSFVDTTAGARVGDVLTYRLVVVDPEGQEWPGEFRTLTVAPRGSAEPQAEPSARGKSSMQRRGLPIVPGNRIRVTVTNDGVYRVTAAEIANLLVGATEAGVATMIQSQGIRLTCNGEAVAWLGEIDGSALRFVGERYSDSYGHENVYWLELAPGLAMAVSNQATALSDTNGWFWETLRVERQNYYQPQLPGGVEDDYFVWDGVSLTSPESSANLANTITLPDAYSNLKTGTVSVVLIGAYDGPAELDNHTRLRAGGVLVAEQQWKGDERIVLSGPTTNLGGTSLTVRVDILRDSGVVTTTVMLDALEVTYARHLRARSNQLLFTARPGTNVLTVRGFTQPDIRVFDLTNPRRPVAVQGTVTPDGAAWQISWSVAESDARRYLASAVDLTPAHMTGAAGVTWRKPQAGGKYVVITSYALTNAAQALVDYRQQTGLNSVLVPIEDLFNEFTYGRRDPTAVREFLKYTSQNWTEKPAYVCLAGDGHQDYHDIFNQSATRPNHIPPVKSRVPVDATPSGNNLTVGLDNPMADWKGNAAPDVRLGRLPAQTPAALSNMIARIIQHEAESTWKKSVLLVSDKDENNAFAHAANRLAAKLPPGLTVKKLPLGMTTPVAEMRANFIQQLNMGPFLASYYGHANNFGISSPYFFQYNATNQIDMLSLTNQVQTPLLVAGTCMLNNFGEPHPNTRCLGKAFLTAAPGGPVAIWSSATENTLSMAEATAGAIVSNLFGADESFLGNVIQNALDLQARSASPWTVAASVLMGDPALRMRPRRFDDLTPPNLNITTRPGASSASNRVALSGTAADFSGVAEVIVRNNRDVGEWVATGTGSWSVNDIPLHQGVNFLDVIATDIYGNATTQTVKVTYSGDAYYDAGLRSGQVVQAIEFPDNIPRGNTVRVRWQILSYVPVRSYLQTMHRDGTNVVWNVRRNGELVGQVESSWNVGSGAKKAKVYSFECDWTAPDSGDAPVDIFAWFNVAQMDGVRYLLANIPDGVDNRPDPDIAKVFRRTLVSHASSSSPGTPGGFTEDQSPVREQNPQREFDNINDIKKRSGGVVTAINIPDNWVPGTTVTCQWTVLAYMDIEGQLAAADFANSTIPLQVNGSRVSSKKSTFNFTHNGTTYYAMEYTFRALVNVLAEWNTTPPGEPGVPRVQIFFRHRIQNSNGTRMACNLASGVDARPYASDGMFGRFIERTIQVSPGP
ncbi:MAG TPA: C25 family cysteine peptidase [Kiritimatiellia bacterium]|nr:C25 family cysteine peptidase [Kiritimatiellia bacterium]